MEERKKFIQVSDFGSSVMNFVAEREKKVWENLEKDHDRLKKELEKQGRLRPQKKETKNE